jgi:hypothetical protein
MKTRRNRRGGANFFSRIASAVGITPDSSAPPTTAPPTTAPSGEGNSGLKTFKSLGTSASNFFGIGNKNTLDVDFQKEIDKLDTTFKEIDAFKAANKDKLPDVTKEVSDLGSLTGYSEAALINAITVHNVAYKMRQLDPGFTSECGPKCAERAQSIRVALRKLVEYSERSDALGKIGLGRFAINNASYGINSTASGVSKFGNLIYSKPKSVAPEPQPGLPQLEPQSQPELQPQPPPVSGGRRRTRRRR